MSLIEKFKVITTIAEVIPDSEEAFALAHGYIFNNNLARLIPSFRTTRDLQEKRALAKLLFQPGYAQEVQRKLDDYIIPFARKASLCYFLF